MDEKKFNRIINNPRHIPGVHNYCDRWCERCPLRMRCSVYAMGEAEGDKGKERRDGMKLWPRLDSLLSVAEQVLKEHADHPGIAPKKEPRFKGVTRAVESVPVGVASKRYMEFAHGFVKEREKEITKLAPAEGLAVSPAEAFEVIAWYHLFITVRLSRAVQQGDRDEEWANDPEMADMPRDSDGSAKVALIGIDHSILAWTVLLKAGVAANEALPAFVSLNRLRRGVERKFPKARGFERPGFDTLRFS